jgi:carboxyl-terminal processing protease
LRQNEPRPIELTLTREIIKIQSVRSKLIEENYGYLRITSFQENTAAEVVRHLNTLYKSRPLEGLVLDLRNCPGGLLNAAIGVSAAFLEPDTLITSTHGRLPDSRREFHASPSDYLHRNRDDFIRNLPEGALTVPMVVLINGGSASASEIVAGALQDHKRATIMGNTSFGKGSVQTIIPLPGNTAIKLTTARYYTPSGSSIQARGIVPDIVVDDTRVRAFTSLRVRESDLENHLEGSGGASQDQKTLPPKTLAPERSQTAPSEDGSKDDDRRDSVVPQGREPTSQDDHQLTQALNFLKGLQVIESSRP